MCQMPFNVNKCGISAHWLIKFSGVQANDSQRGKQCFAKRRDLAIHIPFTNYKILEYT